MRKGGRVIMWVSAGVVGDWGGRVRVAWPDWWMLTVEKAKVVCWAV